jgi:hypothetical protein
MSCTAEFALSSGDSEITGCDDAVPPPSEKIVEFCTGSCLDSAPVKVSWESANVCFNYSSRVDAVVGFMNSEMTKVYWLNRSDSTCSVSMSFDMVLDNERRFFCNDVELPSDVLDEGVVFWFVTSDAMEDVDWLGGPYELRFYSLTCTTEMIGGVCMSCDMDCASSLGGQLDDIVTCEYWQDSHCSE